MVEGLVYVKRKVDHCNVTIVDLKGLLRIADALMKGFLIDSLDCFPITDKIYMLDPKALKEQLAEVFVNIIKPEDFKKLFRLKNCFPEKRYFIDYFDYCYWGVDVVEVMLEFVNERYDYVAGCLIRKQPVVLFDRVF